MNRSYWVLGVMFLLAPFALPQQVALSTTSLTFAPQLVGTSSAPKTLTLTNSGNRPLTVSSIVASGGYSVSSKCANLSPGTNCTISITSISTLVGTTNGVITISDNAASSPQIVDLSGSVLPALVLSPSQVSLGSTALGTTSQPKAVTFTNHGPAFSFGAISTSGDYLQTNNCPATLASGASCTINVSVHPTASGAISGALSISSNDALPLSGVSATLSAVGTGSVASHVSLRPASLNFGNKSALDVFTHSKTVTLTNTSSSMSLTIQSVMVNGPSSSGTPIYQIESTSCKGMLAPGAQCQINVSVGNSNEIPESVPGALTIVDSDPSSPQVVGLSAMELPEVSFSPATLTFAPQKVGTTSATKIITVRSNLDESGISLLPLTVSGDYSLVAAGSNPCGTAPGFNGQGASCTLGVTFTPNQLGVIKGAVTFTLYPECSPEQVIIQHKPCPTAQVVNLTGTGQ